MRAYDYHNDDQEPIAPPHNLDAEQALIGAMLRDNSVFHPSMHYLIADHFYDPVHQRLFGFAREQILKGALVDPITVKARFEQDTGLQEIGGVEYLSFLLHNAPFGSAAPAYAKTIFDLALRRQLAIACQGGYERAMDAEEDREATQITSETIERLSAIQRGGSSDASFCTTQDAVEALLNTDAPNTLDTGIAELDRIAPLVRGGITLLGGRASMGKSALAVQIADNVARAGGRVDFFSLEMDRKQLAARLISSQLARHGQIIPYQHIYRKTINPQDLGDVRDAAQALPELNFDDTPRLTLSDIKSRCLSRSGDIDLVVIDYLNIMGLSDCEGDRHDQKIGFIAGSLRDFAKANNCAVLLLCQLNRDSAKRDNNVPTITDLRDSGELEQHADTIYFAYRRAYYLQRELEAKEAGGQLVGDDEWNDLNQIEDYFDVVVAKQRMGSIGTCKLRGQIEVNLIQDRAS